MNNGIKIKNPTVKLGSLCECIISLCSHLEKILCNIFTCNDRGPSLIQDCLFVLNSASISVFRLEILRLGSAGSPKLLHSESAHNASALLSFFCQAVVGFRLRLLLGVGCGAAGG